MEEEGEVSAVGRSWWPTKACPPRRMVATQWQGSTGTPRRHGAADRRVWTRRGRGEGEDALAGWASFSQRARSEAAAY